METARSRRESARTTRSSAALSAPHAPRPKDVSLVVHLRVPRDMPTAKPRKLDPNRPSRASTKRALSADDEAATGRDDGTSDSSNSASSEEIEIPSVKRRGRPASGVTVNGGSPSKPGKQSYAAMKKEEKEALMREVRVLEARAELLREQAGMPSRLECQSLEHTKTQNRLLRDASRAQFLSFCGMRSLIAQQMREQPGRPFSSHIRLGKDLAKRRETLLSIKREKLDTAYRFVEERLRGVDATRRYSERESWITPDGDYYSSSATIEIFEGVKSVKQVYDAFKFYMANMEISISEVLGQLTIREDIDTTIDSSITNHRLISSTGHGIVLETNLATFSEYHASYADHHGDEFALYVSDFVDEDELYPYSPLERARKNITGVVFITSFRRPFRADQVPTDERGELVVVFRRCGVLSILKPAFPVSQEALDDLGDNVPKWGSVMFKSIRSTLQNTTS